MDFGTGVDGEEAQLPTIVVPGPELRAKVDAFAARLSELEPRKADVMVAKVLSSPKRNQFLFIDSSHIFYPYFLSKVTEYRRDPALRPDKASKSGTAAAGSPTAASPTTTTTTTSTSTTTTKVGTVVRTTGGTSAVDAKREELLEQCEREAKRYLQDPFPSHFSLELRGGTVDMPALLMDVMACTAQYAAKYGEPFTTALLAKQKHNPIFRFLQADDIRHEVFTRLIESYRRILHFDPDETETRLEKMASQDYLLNTVCAEKTKYAQAALARRKAALLTDDELRAKLQWGSFKVLRSFTLSDLGLDGPLPDITSTTQPANTIDTSSPSDAVAGGGGEAGRLPPTTLQPPSSKAPVFAPTFMSSNLVHSSTAPSSRK